MVVANQPLDGNYNDISALRPFEGTVIDLSDGSTSSTGFTRNNVIRVVMKTGNGTIEIKPTPNDTDKVYVPQNKPELFKVNISDKIKVLGSSANIVTLA